MQTAGTGAIWTRASSRGRPFSSTGRGTPPAPGRVSTASSISSGDPYRRSPPSYPHGCFALTPPTHATIFGRVSTPLSRVLTRADKEVVAVADSPLSEREGDVLKAVVETYVRTTHPVSSGAIVRRRGIDVSSATVRNVLRTLEERGFIAKPHTSAGRVPTDSGYRHYVDRLMEPADVSAGEMRRITHALIRAPDAEHDSLIARASRVASQLTHELAVAVAPAESREIVERVEFAPLASGGVLAVVATRSGRFRTVAVEAGGAVTTEDLLDQGPRLSSWLAGLDVGDVVSELRRRLPEADERLRPVVERLLEHCGALSVGAERVHYDGARYILSHPEFSGDPSVLGELLDSEETLADVLCGLGDPGRVVVRIGRENRRRGMRRLSLVVAPYAIGRRVGRMGVIGPTRMRYDKLIGLVGYFARAIERTFSGRPEGVPEEKEEETR
ncbi:MAG: heat-inducible transcription repressor HrcA [Candidatus Eisenbacteria bacterium]|nr:heat-inducible transcription repressor HrcA [Candidatus Eisenbacteria bacterium]